MGKERLDPGPARPKYELAVGRDAFSFLSSWWQLILDVDMQRAELSPVHHFGCLAQEVNSCSSFLSTNRQSLSGAGVETFLWWEVLLFPACPPKRACMVSLCVVGMYRSISASWLPKYRCVCLCSSRRHSTCHDCCSGSAPIQAPLLCACSGNYCLSTLTTPWLHGNNLESEFACSNCLVLQVLCSRPGGR